MARTRWIIATLLLLAGSGIGLAVAAEDQGQGFTVPERHVGDRFVYVDDEGQDRQWQLLEPRLWKDPEGAFHPADLLLRNLGEVALNGQTWPVTGAGLVDARDWTSLAATLGAGASVRSTSGPLSQTETERSFDWAFEPGHEIHPCGSLHSLQGASTWQETIRVGGCDGPMDFTFAGMATWDGQRAMRYEAPDASLLIAPGVPYPVRVEHGEAIHVLTAFTAGQESLRYPVLPEPEEPLPRVPLVAADRYGIPFGDLDDAYPIEQAIQEAQDDPSLELAAFMQRNPEWYVHAAQLELGEGQDWWISITGRDEAVELLINRRPTASAIPLIPTDSWTVSRDVVLDNQRGAPARSELPDQVPALEVAAAAWRAYTGTNDHDMFRFDYGLCVQDCWPYVRTEVAQLPDLPEDDGLLPTEQTPASYEGETMYLEHGGDGALETIGLRTTHYERRSGLLGKPEPATDTPTQSTGVHVDTPTAAAGVGAGLVAGLIVAFWPALKGVPGLALFSRLKPPQILEHPTRQQILEKVQAAPGIHFSELRRQTGLANGSLRHHVRQLVQAGVMQERNAGGYTCFFAGARVAQESMTAAPALKSAGAQSVYGAIAAAPGATSQELAVATGLSVGTIGYHLRRLREAGLVEGRRKRRSVHLYVQAA